MTRKKVIIDTDPGVDDAQAILLALRSPALEVSMQCAKCGTDNPAQAKFCLACGEKLVEACPQCGTSLPAGANFCLQCGTKVSLPATVQLGGAAALTQAVLRQIPKEYAERLLATRGQAHDERRTVTILFSDIKGSTAIIEKLDPEDAKEVVQGAFEFLIAPILRYEGTLVQLMGDAILAFFGAPIAHEDDPERACRAALDITAEAAEYAQKLKKERGIEGFSVRVGINTGLVVVGEVGSDLRVAYTAVGDAINLAARMEQNAEPGTVLITEATHKLVAPLFVTQAMPPLQVKGKAEPAQTYRVLAPKDVAGKVRGIAGLESPMVGREAELAVLREAIERLRVGVGGIVTMVGEAGLGKSRLLAECRAEYHIARPADSRPDHHWGLRWAAGRCVSYGLAVPYLLWLDVLRDLLGVTVRDSPEAAARELRHRVQTLCGNDYGEVYPYLAWLLSLPLENELAARLDELDGQQLKGSTWIAMEKLIQCVAAERPLVLVCEDLHWADSASLELLEHLLALTDQTALLFILVFRPEPGHGSWRLRKVAADRHSRHHIDLRLRPLSKGQSGMLVTNLLRVEQLDVALKARILSTADGNPFYVEEIIRSLIDQGAIIHDDKTGQWRASARTVDVAIPDTLQGLLLARIDRLHEDTKRVLQMASVIGRSFLYRLLAAIAVEERRIDDHLMTLQQEEMIRERPRLPELEYIFKHELTREAAYNGLLKKERRTFHNRVAEALERLFPERIEEQIGLLAYHWERAGDVERATGYLLRAGDQARLAFAHQEAADYYRRALAFLEQQPDPEPAARTWMKLGSTYHNAFDFRQSRQAYDQGFALWQRAAALPVHDLPPAPHALRLVIEQMPVLDPAVLVDASTVRVVLQLFSALVHQTPDLDIVPDAAAEWEVLDGGRRYVFHLRDDACWSDGTPVTAGDFSYAWKRALDPARTRGYGSQLYDIRGARAYHSGQAGWEEVGVRAVDSSTLLLELEEPTAYFLQLLAGAWPVPQHVVQAHGAAWTQVEYIVSNGPFRLEAWNAGQSVILVRNSQYHRRFLGNVQRVELHVTADKSTQLELYEADRLDELPQWNLGKSEMERVCLRHGAESISGPALQTAFLAFNVRRPPFDDVHVRQAFAMALRRDTLADRFYKGFFSPASGGFVPPGMPGHSPGIALPYDPDRARQLLAQAGYFPGSGHTFPAVEWLVWGSDSAGLYDYMRAQWRENLGLDIPTQSLEPDVYLDRVYTQPPDMWTSGAQASIPDPSDFLQPDFMSGRTGWRNEAYERLTQEARRVQDQAERMAKYRQADQILIQEAPVVPIGHFRIQVALKPWVTRFPISPIDEWFWKDVVIEPH